MCLQLISKKPAVMLQVASLAARLKQAEKDAALYNSREALFNKPTTDYSKVKKLWETFEPYQQFWSIAASWKVSVMLDAYVLARLVVAAAQTES